MVPAQKFFTRTVLSSTDTVTVLLMKIFPDTRDSYKCQCKEGFVDRDELRNPGRDCRKRESIHFCMTAETSSDPIVAVNQMCSVGRNDCSPNAKCIERGANGYECVCSADFIDRSPDASRPGLSYYPPPTEIL